MVAFVNEFLSNLREQLMDIWEGMDAPRRWLVLGLTAGVLVFLIFGIRNLTSTDYVPVFTKMQAEDAAEVVAFLKDQNIPYQIGQQGSAVLVPQGKVHEVRMQLASEGLPRGGVVGLELWDHTSLTETDFDRRIRLLRALQGELTRTLMGLKAIDNARVHIVLPENSLFIEAQNPATASVFLVLKQGHVLQDDQIRGIAHLVASSVEGLLPENVTIIDSGGNVLSDRLVTASSGAVNSGQVLQQLEIERTYASAVERSIQAMLERVFGLGRVVVRVKASLDFNYEELREKRSEPVVGSKGVVVSEETRSETYRGTGGGGVPGVTSNIPGYPASTATGESEYEKEEVTRNYEISVSEKYQVKAPGEIQKLSVAVWVDGELAEEQKERVVAMVSSAAGIQPDRGDTVQVDSMPFAADWMTPASVTDGLARARTWDWRLLLIVPAALLLLILVRSRVRQPVAVEEPVPVVDMVIDEDEEMRDRPLSPEEERRLRIRREIERMADEDPEGLARLIRAWMIEE